MNARGIAKLTTGEIFDATNNTDKKYPRQAKGLALLMISSRNRPPQTKNFTLEIPGNTLFLLLVPVPFRFSNFQLTLCL